MTYTSDVVGTDSFTFKANDGNSDSNIALVTITVAAVPAGPVMHVDAIELTLKKAGKNYRADAVVTIVDADGAPVAGATVHGTWSGAASSSSSALTGEDGKAGFSSDVVKGGGTFTLTVTDVVKEGAAYDPSANAETSDSISAP